MKEFESEFDKNLSPEDYIQLMFENTNEKGVLYIPGWYYLDEPTYSLRCKIKWDYKELESAISEVNDLVDNIKKIAKFFREDNAIGVISSRVFEDAELKSTYNKYLSVFNYSTNYIDDIADKIETIKTVKLIKQKILLKEKVEDYEKRLYEEYKDLYVTKDESDLYSSYRRSFYDGCEEKVGSNVGAVDLVMRANRLCKLFEIQAPEIVVNYEACMLAAAYVVHKYATSLEKVNDSLRIDSERLGFMTEEEEEEYLDSLYRPKKRNSRKQMLSLFVYLILRKHSNPNKHMIQQEIMNILAEGPYELTIERKSLSRVIHGLEDEGLGIHSDPKDGIWYDKDEDSMRICALDE